MVSTFQDNFYVFIESLPLDSDSFGLGPQVNCIPTNDIGTTKYDHYDFQSVTLNDVKLFSVKTCRDKKASLLIISFPTDLVVEDIDLEMIIADQPIFYYRTRSKMIASRIESNLAIVSLKILFAKNTNSSRKILKKIFPMTDL